MFYGHNDTTVIRPLQDKSDKFQFRIILKYFADKIVQSWNQPQDDGASMWLPELL